MYDERNCLKKIACNGDIRKLHDGCFGIFVQCDDKIARPHSHNMLYLPGNSAGDIDARLYRLTGLTNLVIVGNPSRIDCGAARTDGSAKTGGQLFE